MPSEQPASRGPAPGDGPFGPPALGDRKTVLEPAEIRRALTRIAHEILERTDGAADVLLLGIPTRGVPPAPRRSGPTTWVRTCPPRSRRWCACCSQRWTARTPCCSAARGASRRAAIWPEPPRPQPRASPQHGGRRG